MKRLLLKQKRNLLIYLFTSILEISGELFFAYFMMTAADIALGTRARNFELLIGLAILSSLYKLFVTYLNDKANRALLNKVMADWKKDIIRAYIIRDKSDNPSEILNTLTNTASQVEHSVLIPLLSMIRLVIFFIGSSISLFFINWKLLLFFILSAWIPLLVPKVLDKKNQAKTSKALKEMEYFVAQIKDVTSGYELIKSFSLEGIMTRLTDKGADQAHHTRYKADSFKKFHENFTGFFSIVIFALGIVLTYYFVNIGSITMGMAMAVFQISNYIQLPLLGIPVHMVGVRSMEKEMEYWEDYISIEEDEDIKCKDFVFEKSINVSSLTYSYEEGKNVLKGIDFDLEKGKKYAIIGPSGCGKSTIAKILMRRLKDYEGKIEVDGVELRDICLDSFYKKVSTVSQDVFLFNDTIKNNIILYNKDLEERLGQAIKQAGLEDLIKNLDNGLDTIIGEYGQDLSGGQKQRISIARSLVKDTELIIMDEATSSLDIATSRSIEKTLLSLNKTLLVITHKLDDEILIDYDKVFKMGKGVFEDEGNWEEISKNIYLNSLR